MPTHPSLTALPRAGKRARVNPLSAGLPDPRPLTDYTAVYDESEGVSQVIVTLDQPCIIRAPAWGFIDCGDGSSIQAGAVSVQGNDTIIFRFDGIISTGVAFIDVPYQDAQVQNFQGGFVRPGAKWFRKPV